jgi:hypothetical protein
MNERAASEHRGTLSLLATDGWTLAPQFRVIGGLGGERAVNDVGRYVYGAAAIALGLVGLAWGDFATVWHPVQDYTPFRTPLAYLSALAILAAGLALQWRRTAAPAFLLLAAFFTIFAFLWAPRIVLLPHIVATWAGFAEQLAVAIAGILGWLALRDRKAPPRARLAAALRITFGFARSFGPSTTSRTSRRRRGWSRPGSPAAAPSGPGSPASPTSPPALL